MSGSVYQFLNQFHIQHKNVVSLVPRFSRAKYQTQISSKQTLKSFWVFTKIQNTVKPVLSDHSKTDKTKTLMTYGTLIKVESIADCSPWSILQYFGPALSENWSSKTNFWSFREWPF